MPRPKGRKNVPPIIADDKYSMEYIKKRAKYIGKSPSAGKLKEIDKEYLLGLLDILEENLRPLVKEGEADYNTNKFRYTPRQMFDNTIKYLRYSFLNYQPITLFGIATFSQIDKDTLWKMVRSENTPKDFLFMRDIFNFVEMYNEYAMHKKQNPAGPIFALKNFGWKDKLEIEASAKQGALTDEEREIARKRIAEFSEK